MGAQAFGPARPQPGVSARARYAHGMDRDTLGTPSTRGLAAGISDEPLAAPDTAVAALAHEINNPITYVLGNLEELERLTGAMREALDAHRELAQRASAAAAEGVAAAEAGLERAGGTALLDELLADAREGARRIRDLARDLVSRPRALRREPVNVAELLDATLRLATPRFPVSVRIERDYRATRRVKADRARLGQVLLNLIANAADACAEGRAERARICARTLECDEGLRIEIEDSGPGVSASARESLFLPFTSTKAPGSGAGLGLFISRRIVEEHGGALGFRSTRSGGTIFWVHLPVEES